MAASCEDQNRHSVPGCYKMAPDYHKYNQYPFVKTAGLTGSQIYRIQHSYLLCRQQQKTFFYPFWVPWRFPKIYLSISQSAGGKTK